MLKIGVRVKKACLHFSANRFRKMLSGWLGNPVKFFRRSVPEQSLFLEALFWLALSRLAIRTVPFRRIAPFLGQTMVETPAHALPEPALPGRISWAVQTASRYTPWESKCLAQAMAAKMMLKLRRLPSTAYLGLLKEGEDGLKAHAWIRCGDRILTGAQGRRQYTVVGVFGDNPQ